MTDNPAPESTPSWELLYPEIWRGTDDQRIRITFVAGPAGEPPLCGLGALEILAEITPHVTPGMLIHAAEALAGYAKNLARNQAAAGDERPSRPHGDPR